MGRRKKRWSLCSDSDSDFHDNGDEEFSVVLHKKSQPKKTTPKPNRKKLALPKHSKDQKSLFVDVQEQGTKVNEDAVDVFDSEDDSITNIESRRFQTLLDAVFDKSGELLAPLPDHLTQPEILVLRQGIEGGTCSSKQDMRGDLQSVDEQNDQDEDYCVGQNETEDDSCSEEEQDNEDEDYCADDSDDLGRVKRKQKNKKNTIPVASEPKKANSMVFHAKKVRSMVMYKRKRTASENRDKCSMSPTIATDNGKESPELSSIEPPKSKSAGHVGECDKENSQFLALKNIPSGKSANVKTMHSSNITKRFRTTALAGLKNSPFPSPDAKILQFQASLLPHQRVLGLSRRVRPAPLHPYLSKPDK